MNWILIVAVRKFDQILGETRYQDQIRSDTISRSVVSDSLRLHEL